MDGEEVGDQEKEMGMVLIMTVEVVSLGSMCRSSSSLIQKY